MMLNITDSWTGEGPDAAILCLLYRSGRPQLGLLSRLCGVCRRHGHRSESTASTGFDGRLPMVRIERCKQAWIEGSQLTAMAGNRLGDPISEVCAGLDVILVAMASPIRTR